MNRSQSELDNAVCTTYSVKEDCWLGHVIQMDHQHIPRQALHWEVPGFQRGPGRPHTNWRSTVNKDLLWMGITWEEAGVAAQNRSEWRRSVAQQQPNASTWMRVESRSRSRSFQGREITGEKTWAKLSRSLCWLHLFQSKILSLVYRVANSQISLTWRWDRDAKGVEGEGTGMGRACPPSRLWGLGERRKLPSGVQGRAPPKLILVHYNLERTHLTTRYLVFSDITCVQCTENDWKSWDIGIGDWRQTAKRKVSTICIFPGFCKCSFCPMVTCTCHITASLYFYLYCLWGIKWWWCRLWWLMCRITDTAW